jgi:cell wall-associated NlpC family hydrolase
MMPHPRPRGGQWLLALAAGCTWLLAGQHLAGQAGADQAGIHQAATIAPPTSTPVQHHPAPQPHPAPTQHRPTSPPSSTRTSPRSSTETSQQQAARAVAFALAQRGKLYELGAEGPDAYDCSGLVWRAWQHTGFDWERMTAAGQWQWLHSRGHDLPAKQLRPGDLLFYAHDATDAASIHHVAMAVGEGRMVEGPPPGTPSASGCCAGAACSPLPGRPPDHSSARRHPHATDPDAHRPGRAPQGAHRHRLHPLRR